MRAATAGLATLLLAAAVVAVGLGRRAPTPARVSRLLAEAYRVRRTLEPRLPGAEAGPLRVTRGDPTLGDERPLALLEAEAEIGRMLDRSPASAVWLGLRGRAHLQEGAYEAALTDLQQALGADSRSVTILGDLATAYFERGEATGRFADYGLAFELQSRGLRAEPANPVLLFNRAIAAERLFLFAQGTADCESYLRLDSAGAWADEARQRLARLRARLAAHRERLARPLLPASAFAESVDPSNPATWDEPESRIEEYLRAAVTDWLVRAFPADPSSPPDLPARRALDALARVLQERHGDAWLAELIPAVPDAELGRAIAALRRAVVANATEDFSSAREQAVRAAHLFRDQGVEAGVERALFEEVYALHFSDRAEDCLRGISRLLPSVSRNRHAWLSVQLHLEQAACSTIRGDRGETRALATSAQQEARAGAYAGLALRAHAFRAGGEVLAGRHAEAWPSLREGLEQFWNGTVAPMAGYNLYAQWDLLTEAQALWHLNVAVDKEGLALAGDGNPLMRAVELTRLAHAAEKAGDHPMARASLVEAARSLGGGPETEARERFRFGIDVDMARIEGQMAATVTAIERLQALRPRLGNVLSEIVLASFYTTLGGLQLRQGDHTAALAAFEVAVGLSERERASLATEESRQQWAQASGDVYRGLVEAKLRCGDTTGALAAWELYRGSALRPRRLGAGSAGAWNEGALALSARRRLAEETALLDRLAPALDGRLILVYAILPTGIQIWALDEQGLTSHRVSEDPTHLRLLCRRFAELCANVASSPAAIRASSRQLHDLLIGPVAGRIGRNRAVVIEADTEVAEVPFQALTDTAGIPFVERHDLTYTSGLREWSLSTGGEAGLAPGAPALVVANPLGDPSAGLAPLTEAVIEGRHVAQAFPRATLLIGRQATTQAVREALSGATLFHFVGHAVRGRHGTGLLLAGASSGRRETPAVLDPSFVRGSAIGGLRLAVLSACSTERGKEGMIWDSGSLAHALLQAGVPHVVATRWDVDSAASAELMRDFYAALVTGASPARALAHAEALMRRRSPHPYYWAAFDAFGR